MKAGKRNNIRRLIFILQLFAVALPFYPRQPDYDSLLKWFVRNIPWEEMYIHTDRARYIAGEQIWMSIYNIDRISATLTGRNQVAFIELLNPWNVPVIKAKFSMSGGKGEGNILLPDTLTQGTYTLRGYSNYMKNFMPLNCYMQSIEIYNPARSNIFYRKTLVNDPDEVNRTICFYPEGGNLIAGLECRVAVRAFDKYGRGEKIHGVVTDNKGDTIASFETDLYGLGSFLIRPSTGVVYKAVTPSGTYLLPSADTSNASLSVIKKGGTADVLINAGGTMAIPGSVTYNLVMQSAGKVTWHAEIKGAGSVTKITLPSGSLRDGVNHLSLILPGRDVISERLFLYRIEQNGPELILKKEAGRRENIKAEIHATDMTSSNGTFSVSITQAVEAGKVQGISGYIMSGSEFGIPPWHNAGYGFNEVGEASYDNYLISTKSRWIDWKSILQGTLPQVHFYNESEGHYLSGRIRRRDGMELDTNIVIYASVEGQSPEFYYSATDNTGQFNLLLPVDFKTRRLVLQPSQTDDNILMEIASPWFRSVPHCITFPDSLSAGEVEEVSVLSFNYQASMIYGTLKSGKSPEPAVIEKSVKRFYGKPELEIRLDDYIKLPTMQEVFFELVPGVQLRSRKQGYEFRMMNPYTRSFYNGQPLTMIDGVIFADATLIAGLDPENVERIDVISAPYIIGDLYIEGLINVVTRSGKINTAMLPDYAVILPYRTVDRPSSFARDGYVIPGENDPRIPDLRNTVFWSPSVRADENGILRIEFRTSDLAGDYILRIEGAGKSGNTFSAEGLIKVR